MLNANRPITYLITSGELTTHNYWTTRQSLLSIIRTAVEFNVSYIQIREKNLTASYLFDLVKDVTAITKFTDTKAIVNERADIAVAAGADGVHLRSDSMSSANIKTVFPDLITIVSCHSFDDLATAVSGSADLVTFSPIFDSPSKGDAKGLKHLKDAVDSFPRLSIIALGGVGLHNFKQVLECGVAGFAAIRSLNNTDNLRRLNEEIRQALN